MGVVSLEHMNGSWLYSCRICKTNLSNKTQLISTQFQACIGKGYFFKRVINVTCGKPVKKQMQTGNHLVRDVCCKLCGMLLGWTYEHAENRTECYKEGKYVLEEALIELSEGINDSEIK